MEKAIGTLVYLKGTFADGRVVYWHKTKEYVDKAKNATFYKSPKLAEKAKKNWEDWWNAAKGLAENYVDKPTFKFEDVNPWINWEVKYADVTEAK